MTQGSFLSISELESGFWHLELCHPSGVNILGSQAIHELGAALKQLLNQAATTASLKGLLLSSRHEDFVLGADIKEFIPLFLSNEESIYQQLVKTHEIFNALENLPAVTVCAIKGLCLGGGLELALCCDYRIASPDAKLSFPETRLGIMPGFGGTVRFSRLVGVDNAVEWIASAKEYDALASLKVGAIDAIAEQDLHTQALSMLKAAQGQTLNWSKKRQQKQLPLQLAKHEMLMTFESCKAAVGSKAGKHYPAPLASVTCMQKHAAMPIEQALLLEAREFTKLARSETSKNLISLFLADQFLKKKAKGLSQEVPDINRVAVLGAGIMGGGIAGQAAKKGILSLMKDINHASVQLGLNEAARVYGGALARGKMTAEQVAESLNRIWPTLSYGDFAQAEVVIEAVVENPKVKAQVFAELSQQLTDDCIIASNTSSIPISMLAKSVAKPENFAGLHFFNPVHRMPLVEVIRGPKTSDQTIAKLVKLASQMGKSVVVVNDCPGFFVNRVLFPYFAGFLHLLAMGQDFERIDRVMTDFGWPMGPANLLDVVGLDTAMHASAVMASAFPDRMLNAKDTPLAELFAAEMLGQKNGQGFYLYQPDAKGKVKPQANPEAKELLASGSQPPMSDEDIIARVMIPMAFETLRCLQEGIVATATEADMALIYGLGFPPFRGGICHWMDAQGLAKLVAQAKEFQDSPIYGIPDQWQNQSPLYAQVNPKVGGNA